MVKNGVYQSMKLHTYKVPWLVSKHDHFAFPVFSFVSCHDTFLCVGSVVSVIARSVSQAHRYLGPLKKCWLAAQQSMVLKFV